MQVSRAVSKFAGKLGFMGKSLKFAQNIGLVVFES